MAFGYVAIGVDVCTYLGAVDVKGAVSVFIYGACPEVAAVRRAVYAFVKAF